MARNMTAAAVEAAEEQKRQQFFFMAELEFDSKVRESLTHPGEPDTLIEWKTIPSVMGTEQPAEMVEVSYDGETWYSPIVEAEKAGWSYSLDHGTGVTSAPLPNIQIGDSLGGTSIRTRITLLYPGLAINYVTIRAVMVNANDEVLTREYTERTYDEWADGDLYGCIAVANPNDPEDGKLVTKFYNAAAFTPSPTATPPAGACFVARQSYSERDLWLSRGKEGAWTFVGAPIDQYYIDTTAIQYTTAEDAAMTVEMWVFLNALPAANDPIALWFWKGPPRTTSPAGAWPPTVNDPDGDPTIGTSLRVQSDGSIRVDSRFLYWPAHPTVGALSARHRGMHFSSRAGVVQIGIWHHIAFVHSGTQAQIVVDGKSVAYVSTTVADFAQSMKDPETGETIWWGDSYQTGGWRTRRLSRGFICETRGTLTIGCDPTGTLPTRFLNGKIGDIRLWNSERGVTGLGSRQRRPLTAQEVARFELIGLKAYWSFEGSSRSERRRSKTSNGIMLEPICYGQHDPMGLLVMGTQSPKGWPGRRIPNDPSGRLYPFRVSRAMSLGYAGDTLHITNAPFDIAWDGNTYIGVGNFGGVDGEIQETSDLESRTIKLTLSGVIPDFISLALGQHYMDRGAKLYGVYFDEDGVMVADPVLLFQGKMDTMPIAIEKERGAVSVTIESRFAEWESSATRRWSYAEQRRRFPDDKGLEFIAVMKDKELWWPGRIATEVASEGGDWETGGGVPSYPGGVSTPGVGGGF
jgi:hypothetical protein